MEQISEELQKLAVEKVLQEMQNAEEIVKGWNSTWYEQCLDAYSESLYNTGMSYVQDIERKYYEHYKLANVYYPENRVGVPLRKVTLVDFYGRSYECEFGRIDWGGMNSNKSSRNFSFNNNGDIIFEKKGKIKQSVKHPRRISYKASYNVLSSDFDINITLDELTQDRINKYKYDYLTLSLKENILIKKHNDIEIIQDLSKGIKVIRIVKEYDKHNQSNNASIVFEATINPDDSLEMGSIAIDTHKSNGKINGTYRFNVSRSKGVQANYYSRKGVKVDLTTNPMLLGTANTLLLPSVSSKSSSDAITSSIVSSTQKAIAKGLTEKVISFDDSDFNLEAIKQAETRIIEMVKCIRGEFPLPGLVDRIDNCLSLFDNKNKESKGEAKILRIKQNN